MADYPRRVTKTAFSRSAGACPPQSPDPHENPLFAVERGPVPRDANCLNHDFQDVQDGAGFSRFARFTGFFCRRVCRIRRSCATERGGAAAVGEPSWSRCAFGETDVGEGQALALRYKGRCCGPVARGPVPRARCGRARQAPVVRDRLIANMSGSGDPHLQRGVVRRR